MQLREKLTTAGLDAGPDTIAWHLAQHHQITVARSAISRHLTRAGLVIPEPKKRPKSSYVRFEAQMPTRPGSPTSPTQGGWRRGAVQPARLRRISA